MKSSDAMPTAPGMVVNGDCFDFTAKDCFSAADGPFRMATSPVARPATRYWEPLVLKVALNWPFGFGVSVALALPSETPAALKPRLSSFAPADAAGSVP